MAQKKIQSAWELIKSQFVWELMKTQPGGQNMDFVYFWCFWNEHKGTTPLRFSVTPENRFIPGKAWCGPYAALNA